MVFELVADIIFLSHTELMNLPCINKVTTTTTTGMKEFLATGYHNTNNTLPRSNQGKDRNRRIVYASYEMGVGKEGIAKLCEVLNMPFSMAKLTWYNHEDMLFEAHQDVVLAMLEKNREEARKIALEEDGVDKNDTT